MAAKLIKIPEVHTGVLKHPCLTANGPVDADFVGIAATYVANLENYRPESCVLLHFPKTGLVDLNNGPLCKNVGIFGVAGLLGRILCDFLRYDIGLSTFVERGVDQADTDYPRERRNEGSQPHGARSSRHDELGLKIILIALALTSVIVFIRLALRAFREGDEGAGALCVYGAAIAGSLGGFVGLLLIVSL